MKIVVLVKEVPDTYGDRELSTATGLAARDLGDRVLDEIGERAIELAVTYAEAHPGTEITMVSMGPEAITSSLRRGLALGVDSAIHVLDDELAGADLTLTADVLAAAIARAGYDLVIAGNQSTDGVGGVIPAMVAELLDIPAATALHSVEIAEGQVTGQRATDSGVEEIRAELPAIISITEALPEPRMPNFKGIVAAKKKPIETLGLSELGVVADTANTPRSIMTVAQARPPRSAGVKLVGDDDAGVKLADFLRERKLV